jgi:hypothetical protein
LRCNFGSSGQKYVAEGEEDLALCTQGKKKAGKGARQGPKIEAKPHERYEQSEVVCL